MTGIELSLRGFAAALSSAAVVALAARNDPKREIKDIKSAQQLAYGQKNSKMC